MTTKAMEEVVIRAGRPAPAPAVAVPEHITQEAQQLCSSYEAKLRAYSDRYVAEAMKRARRKDAAKLEAEPVVPVAPPYPWWNLVLIGPVELGLGTFQPNRIIRTTSFTLFGAAIWLNPAPIAWIGGNPSAATVMSAFNFQVQLETINLTTVADGPDLTAPPLGPGLPPLVVVPLIAPPGLFPAPASGKPHLYEGNLTADVTGPVPGLPFAGYSTWVLDLDTAPPFPPFGLPPVPAGFQSDIPARFMVYTA
ncbi:MAG TPA: hypothetical protein VNL77_12085 [Roseiflexaceae bacterium]|nr:hypothetical protein [Roseiflexaceae bacterium]